MAQSCSNCLEYCVRLPVTLALSLLLLWPSCAHHPPPQAPRIELREEGTRRGEPYVKLAFRPSLTGAVRERLTPGEAWVLVAALEEAFKTPEWRARVGLWHPEFSSGPSAPLPLGAREQWRRALGMTLQDAANIVYLVAHQGPHPAAYHEEVYQRLDEALGNCSTQPECRSRLVGELDRIATDICKPGSRLNKLIKR